MQYPSVEEHGQVCVDGNAAQSEGLVDRVLGDLAAQFRHVEYLQRATHTT